MTTVVDFNSKNTRYVVDNRIENTVLIKKKPDQNIFIQTYNETIETKDEKVITITNLVSGAKRVVDLSLDSTIYNINSLVPMVLIEPVSNTSVAFITDKTSNIKNVIDLNSITEVSNNSDSTIYILYKPGKNIFINSELNDTIIPCDNGDILIETLSSGLKDVVVLTHETNVVVSKSNIIPTIYIMGG